MKEIRSFWHLIDILNNNFRRTHDRPDITDGQGETNGHGFGY